MNTTTIAAVDSKITSTNADMNPHIPTSIACRIAVDEDLSTSTSKASTTKYEAMTRLQLKQLLDGKDATVTSRKPT